MKDWQEIGREVRNEWRQERDKWDQVTEEVQREASERRMLGTPFDDFTLALTGYQFLDKHSELIEYLRSDRAVPADWRKRFADVLEFKHKRPQRGRPKNQYARDLAETASIIYGLWKDRNKREGINDWGMGDAMKDQACLYALEVEGQDYEEQPDIEVLRELMDRPNNRRK